MMIEKSIVYFDAPGSENTCKVLELVKKTRRGDRDRNRCLGFDKREHGQKSNGCSEWK